MEQRLMAKLTGTAKISTSVSLRVPCIPMATALSQALTAAFVHHEHSSSGTGTFGRVGSSTKCKRWSCRASHSSSAEENDDEKIPATSGELLKKLSSEALDVRRKLEQNLESSSYDVLESNPWRGDSKPVYVLAREEDALLTMRTRRERSEVENELNMLFSNKRGSRRGRNGSTISPSNFRTGFRMQVEDIREGVLVFEDQDEASRYCNLLDGNCRGIAEIEASDVFALCQRNKALAVLFRRGMVPPTPERLQRNLKARKHSLED